MESGPLPSKPDERPRGLVEKILLGLRRDANLTITQRLRKGVRLLWDTARTPSLYVTALCGEKLAECMVR